MVCAVCLGDLILEAQEPVRELAKALKPFAAWDIKKYARYDDRFIIWHCGASVRVGHIRQARAALAAMEANDANM